ncbi:hypothetical protein ckrop_0276 [Corynebacterium kroppenstedtii DSM 44385]|uniref:Uncharacterized protein n=1 Tax=Corynebacterium kroppenstedtii (strain DSM 44385 / JCM 11950 / CIP 105744 / CCUG 35717) TaxID=645127 RepID=C4LGV7_CORK4|nr:hypothetical protein ckrop_0276 [Corynebacterium kroppenstedtii DSM 44385]
MFGKGAERRSYTRERAKNVGSERRLYIGYMYRKTHPHIKNATLTSVDKKS